MANIDEFTKLPAPPTAPPSLPSGHVVLYRDTKWTSQRLDLALTSYVEGVRHSIGGTPLQDAASWVAFNLPIGTVMTLMEHLKPVEEGKQLWDLRNCGRCIDLVGTGKTEGVNLHECNMKDCVTAFFWRKVDLDLGAIELFEHVDFRGNRSTVFLSEWPSGTVHAIGNWWLNDRVSSARWKTLHDRQKASLFQHSDGSGISYQNVVGWGLTKQIRRLGDVSFNDCMSSFRWDGLVPMKEIIAPFTLPHSVAEGSDLSDLCSTQTGTNDTDLPQPVKLTLKNSTAQTLTVTSTDKYATGFSVSYKTKPMFGLAGETTFNFSFSYEKTETRTTTTTRTEELSVEVVVNAPPRTKYEATLLVQMARLQGATFHTTAERWYDERVTGGVLDPANGWYKRTEPVTGAIDGALGCNTITNIKATPIGLVRAA